MNTSLPRRGPSPFNPGATTSQPKSSHGSLTSPQPTRTKSRTESRRNAAESEPNDTSGDKNTVALIRRVLCPDVSAYGTGAPRPLHELLPPLTSSNDVDLQLYALIAVIVKEFVYSWYARITPDHVFVDEVLQLIAHCTRALEQRLRRVDVGQLILDDVTGLIEAHITAYRIATEDSHLVALKPSFREIYHHLNPHPGLSPVPDISKASSILEQQENENLYRHLLAEAVLAVLLPTEDLENVCLRTLVEDVLSDLILGNQVSGRICEGWFIWNAISKVITVVKQRDSEATVTLGQSLDAVADSHRLERFGLLSEDRNEDSDAQKQSQSTISLWLWKILYFAYLAYVTIRFIVGGLLHTALSDAELKSTEILKPEPATKTTAKSRPSPCRPILGYRAFGLVSELLRVSDRMPWLHGSISLIQSILLTSPGKIGDTGSVLDRYLRDLLSTYMLTPTILPVLLFTVRTTLFPSNARPASVPANNNTSWSKTSRVDNDVSPILQPQQGRSVNSTDHQTDVDNADIKCAATPTSDGLTLSPSEIAAIKRQCATDILSLIPGSLARAFFRGTAENHLKGVTADNSNDSSCDEVPLSAAKSSSQTSIADEEELLEAIELDLLDPFSDAYCNKHLIYAVVELVLTKLIPELSEQSVSSLMEERGITA